MGKLWLKFIKPWEAYDPQGNLIDRLQTFDIQSKESSSFYESQHKLVSRIDVTRRDTENNFFIRDENYNSINKFIRHNLLFYIHILSEYLIAFSDLNDITFKDVNSLREIMGII